MYRAALRLRRRLRLGEQGEGHGVVFDESAPAGVLVLDRGEVRVVVNTTSSPVPLSDVTGGEELEVMPRSVPLGPRGEEQAAGACWLQRSRWPPAGGRRGVRRLPGHGLAVRIIDMPPPETPTSPPTASGPGPSPASAGFDLVLLGSGLGVYTLARAFHEEYGVVATVVTKIGIEPMRRSVTCEVLELGGAASDEDLIDAVIEL